MGHTDDINYKPNKQQLAELAIREAERQVMKAKAKPHKNQKITESSVDVFNMTITATGGQFTPICSILPQFALLADSLKNPKYKELGKMANDMVPLAKWVVDMLVTFKRTHENESLATHKTLYAVKAKNFKERPPNTLPKKGINFLLWNKALELEKFYKDNKLKSQKCLKWLNHCLGSTYSLCTKLDFYRDKYGDKCVKDVHLKRMGNFK